MLTRTDREVVDLLARLPFVPAARWATSSRAVRRPSIAGSGWFGRRPGPVGARSMAVNPQRAPARALVVDWRWPETARPS